MSLTLDDLKKEFHGGGGVPASTYPILKIDNDSKSKSFGNFIIQSREMKEVDGKQQLVKENTDTEKKKMDLIILKRRYYYSWFANGDMKLCTSEFDDWQDVVYLLEGGKDIIKHGFWKRDIKPYLLEKYPTVKGDGSKGHPLTYQNVLYVCDEFGKVYKMYLRKTSIVGPEGGWTKGDAEDTSFQGWLEANDDKVPLQLKVELGTKKAESKMGPYYHFTFKTKGETADVQAALDVRGDLDQDLWEYEKARFSEDALPPEQAQVDTESTDE